MNANGSLITGILNNSTLVQIPFFQRPYVWKVDLWERLLDDMEYITKTQHTHFLGSIILKKDTVPTGVQYTEKKILVDGQQRLTTFLIFLKVLFLKIGQTTFFDYNYRIMGKELSLKHGKNDIQNFEFIMSTTVPEKIDNNKNSKIIDAYNYFVQHIDINKLDLMTIVMKVQFVRIDLDADENE